MPSGSKIKRLNFDINNESLKMREGVQNLMINELRYENTEKIDFFFLWISLSANFSDNFLGRVHYNKFLYNGSFTVNI